MSNPLHHLFSRWALVVTAAVCMSSAVEAQTKAEYFIDEDPGQGSATTVTQAISPDGTLLFNISTSSLAPGEHLVGIRAYSTTTDDQGVPHTAFGPTITQRVIVKDENAAAQQILYAEYFWGDDPGYGKGTSIPLTPGQDLTMSNIQIPTDGLAAGEYNLSVRAFGSMGWGPTITQRVIVKDENAAAQKILYAEYFWGDDPGFGKGSPILLTPGQEVTLSDLPLPTGEAHGSSILSIRAYGTKGWGPTLVADILVDAEGTYTLNASAETSLTERNYQSLTDIVADFSDRGVGDDVTLTVVGTGAEYALDATTDDCLAQIAQIAQSLAGGSTSRDERLITFTAAEGSGNSLAITTTDDGLPTVVDLFAHIATENVTLTINGTAYDFTAAARRHEELCSGTATQAVALGSISSAVTVGWSAQPHAGTTITGYDTSGTGDLPVMTLRNSGIACDSVTYAVTLTDRGGRTLTTYDYTYIVHANVATQIFTTLTPANGSSVDPGKATLQWSAIGDATGYTVTITSQKDGEEPTTTTVETTDTSCDLTVESGVTYTWTVTAHGYCDEMTGAAMTLTGRLLPDLAVGSITLPEAAQAGNALTVRATVANQGAGATTEGTWTDRLYYTVNSTNFDDAVLLAEATHSGNLAAGGSYEAVFETTTPMADSGQLRVFVITDSQGQVMESDDDNNRTMSTTAAELHPFYMNTDDLAALRKLYSDFGGEEWSGEPWDVDATIIKDGNWSGVTFDADGRVTAINLQGRGLSGALSAATAPTLPLLTTLNLSRNALTGDAATFVSTTLQPALTTLNLSYNLLDVLSAPLPAALTTLNLSSQHRTYGNDRAFVGLDDTEPQTLDVAGDLTVALPAIATYNHARQAFDAHPQLSVRDLSNQTIATLTWSAAREAYAFSPNGWQVKAGQDAEVVIIPVTTSGDNGTSAANSAFAAQLRFTAGDANLSGWTDVNDVQRTLNYVLDTNNSTTFGLWAANTYDDDAYDPDDETINIQDIVCTVNIVLDNESGAVIGDTGDDGMLAPRRALRTDAHEAPAAWFYADNRRIMLDADEEVAAFSISLSGVSASQVRLLLNARDWQMQTRDNGHGVTLVVFSPTGRVLPTGTTTLLRLSADGEPTSAQATDVQAEEVAAAIGTPTRIARAVQGSAIRVTAAEGRRIILSADRAYGPTTVSVYSPSGLLLTRQHLKTLPAGDTAIRLDTASDVVIVSVSNAEIATSNHQIMTRP